MAEHIPQEKKLTNITPKKSLKYFNDLLCVMYDNLKTYQPSNSNYIASRAIRLLLPTGALFMNGCFVIQPIYDTAKAVNTNTIRFSICQVSDRQRSDIRITLSSGKVLSNTAPLELCYENMSATIEVTKESVVRLQFPDDTIVPLCSFTPNNLTIVSTKSSGNGSKRVREITFKATTQGQNPVAAFTCLPNKSFLIKFRR